MSSRSKLWRGKRCRWLLIGISCTLIPLLTRNAAAITVTSANGGTAANAATNYVQNRNYEDAAAATAAVVTAAMNAAALPMAKTTTNDYAKQLPHYYAALTTDLDNANSAAAEPIYRNYFENTDTGSGDKIDAATVILRDHMAQWHLPAASGQPTDESAMTGAGFVPTTMTAAGQHYAKSTSADAAAAVVGHAHAGVDFSTNSARAASNAARSVDSNSAGATYAYEYATPKGKIDYEFNEANFQSASNGDNNGSGNGYSADQLAVTVAKGGANMGAVDAYGIYKYDMSEYAQHLQRALTTTNMGNKEAHYAAAVDSESANQSVGVGDGGGGGTYFENHLPSYENYFMPTYQIGQFSNYHSQQAEQELKRRTRGEEQARQNEQPSKTDGPRQEEARIQLRPLTLLDNADDNNAMLQQFKKGANIENYANDRQKLHYFAKQPQLEQQQQPQQQQQERQEHAQQQYQEQQRLQEHYQQQVQKQTKQQQQKLFQQQQQLQLSHQPRKFPELMHFSLHQHLPRQRQRLATALSKVARPHNPVALSTRRRRQQRRDATSLQVIGNAGRQSSLPALKQTHVTADGSSKANSNVNTNDDTLTLHSRLGNDKRSISENFVDITSKPTQYSYAHVYPTHVSQLIDDSANEIDDTPNNIDDIANSDKENEEETNRRDQQQHYLAAISHPQVKAYHQHNGALVQQYTLPPITTSERHTPASIAALAGIPLARHVEVTKHIPTIDYERVHVPYNQSVPIHIPQPIITAVPRPYAIRVPVAKTVAVPKVQEVRIPIEKVTPFPVERPVPFIVERRVPYMVEKQVAKPVYYPYPVKVPIVRTIVHKMARRPHSYTTY
nr:AF4/FMR2 family member lilli [Bactrocera oleae]